MPQAKVAMQTGRGYMKIQRSRTGCLYCRRRKIKCDEKSPSCSACMKRGLDCDQTTSIFRPHRSLLSCPTPLATTNEGTAFSESVLSESDNLLPTRGDPSFRWSNPATDTSYPPDPTSTDVPHVAGPRSSPREHNGYQSAHRVDQYRAQSDHCTNRFSATTCQTPNKRNRYIADTSMDCEIDEGIEINDLLQTSSLTRHFSETFAKWMDLFDLDYFYSRQIPIRARHSSLLRYAACAIAAKQISRARHSMLEGDGIRQSAMKTSLSNANIDYAMLGVRYYNKSIAFLMAELSRGYRMQQDGYNSRYNDDTILAATILCNYEFLSATTEGWSRHLDGTESLLRISHEGNQFHFQPSPRHDLDLPNPSKALRAAFWNFARQDFLASLIARKHGRLDTSDLGMWRAMGLALNDDGLVTNDLDDTSNNSSSYMGDDMVSNALVWLLSKITNHIASPANDDTDSTTWRTLGHELEVWHDSLPPSFEPSARITLAEPASTNLRVETWYSSSMCASTMQSYHMACILLLINKPDEIRNNDASSPALTSTSMAKQDLLTTYRQLQNELHGHAIEICAIALSRPDPAARIHMLQPLYVAGRCLTDVTDQQLVLALIREIETELGWATAYRVEQLVAE